jgi:precorrin-3B C17-methyltransferase
LYVVGIGPGHPLDRTRRAEEAISRSSFVVGYTPYIDQIRDLLTSQETLSTGMMKESERCRAALHAAAQGQIVALISSGDAGIYGMAGLALEMLEAERFAVEIEIIAGVSASNAAAAQLGAPLMLDSAMISLSDLLVPWEQIVTRLEAVAKADMVVSLYNPRSKKRTMQLEQAATIFKAVRPLTTPVGIVTAASRAEQQLVVTDLEHFLTEDIGMNSIVIIGNKSTRLSAGLMVTPRGYYR